LDCCSFWGEDNVPELAAVVAQCNGYTTHHCILHFKIRKKLPLGSPPSLDGGHIGSPFFVAAFAVLGIETQGFLHGKQMLDH
jgi:hypothetical protein